jgi:hypothetical protein
MLQLAIAFLAMTLLRHYGYYFLPGVPARVAGALMGIHTLFLLCLIVFLMFNKIQDWRALIVLLVACIVAFAENTMIAVCGSWYAFVYRGPMLVGDTCEAMTNAVVSKPMAFALVTFGAIFLPLMWKKHSGRPAKI